MLLFIRKLVIFVLVFFLEYLYLCVDVNLDLEMFVFFVLIVKIVKKIFKIFNIFLIKICFICNVFF